MVGAEEAEEVIKADITNVVEVITIRAGEVVKDIKVATPEEAIGIITTIVEEAKVMKVVIKTIETEMVEKATMETAVVQKVIMVIEAKMKAIKATEVGLMEDAEASILTTEAVVTEVEEPKRGEEMLKLLALNPHRPSSMLTNPILSEGVEVLAVMIEEE